MTIQRPNRLLDLLPPDGRLVLAFVLLFGGINVGFKLVPLGVGVALLGLYLILDVLRNGGVWAAFRAFRHGRLDRVRRLVSATRFPRQLNPASVAYYNWLKGVLEAERGRFAAARVHLLVAASGQLKTQNDRTLVQCLLAEAALQEGDPVTASHHLQLASALEHRPEVDGVIASLARRAAAQ